MISYSHYKSPLGIIEIYSSETHIVGVRFGDSINQVKSEIEIEFRESDLIKLAIEQLEAYFKGNLKEFSVPFCQEGTPFQHQVWNELLRISYGKTKTYTDLAIHLGDKKKIRAVGTANGLNAIAILVPCHRIIGKNGKLVGYAGGLWRKKFLLTHEFNHSPLHNRLF